VPDDIDSVPALVVWRRGLAKEVDWTWASDVDLLGVVARKDKDMVWRLIVRQAQYCRLDGRKVTAWSDEQCVFRTSVQWLFGGILACFSVGCRYSCACL
jgi:hypothetical protein